MEQEYTVRSWKAWEDRDNDGEPLRDNHGNYKGSVVFEEHSSEQVDATFKDQPKPGDKKYGVIEDYQTKSGKTRTKFSRRDRPDANQTSFGSKPSGSKKTEWQPRDDMAIRAQWAIGQAVTLHDKYKKASSDIDYVFIESAAKELFAMVDRVKGSQDPENLASDEGWADAAKALRDEYVPEYRG